MAIHQRNINETRGSKYLTFQLGQEHYGLEILKSQEIIVMTEITRVPRTPDFIRGVINLRGKVIPVVDMRLKFNLPSKADTERTCIVVAQVFQGEQQVTMGMVVDEVTEVITIKEDQLEPPPLFGTVVDTEFILGMGKLGGKILTILDIDRVLTSDEVCVVAKTAQAAESSAS